LQRAKKFRVADTFRFGAIPEFPDFQAFQFLSEFCVFNMRESSDSPAAAEEGQKLTLTEGSVPNEVQWTNSGDRKMRGGRIQSFPSYAAGIASRTSERGAGAALLNFRVPSSNLPNRMVSMSRM